jgi:hypothetical protein
MGKKKFVGVQFVETVRDGKRTFAFGIYQDGKVGRVPFSGLAEKNPEDKDNPTRGRNLAIGRALENLGKEIEKREWKKLQRKGTETESKPLSAAEIKKLKSTPEAVALRKKRAAKKAKKAQK